MKHFRKNFLIFLIALSFLMPQKVNAADISGAVDKGINGTSKAAYCITKYTLKAGWFVIKKTAKCSAAVLKSVFKGTNDAFKSQTKPQSVKVDKNNDCQKADKIYKLPPAPVIQ